MQSKYIFIIIFLPFFVNNKKCTDENCNTCSKNGNYCYQCKEGFIRHYSYCGIICNSIINCELCNKEQTKCVKCKSNCFFNGKYCDCTERYVLTIISIFIAITTISVIVLCLINTSWNRTINSLSLLSGYMRTSIFNNFNRTNFNLNSPISLSEEEKSEIENKINETKIINDFNKNKIKEDKNIEKKKCFSCKRNDCNLKLNCGCYLCFECEKKSIRTNKCLNCHKNIVSMQQISCSICFCSKKEISSFNCPCKTVVCKECYVRWRKQNNFCPSCRAPIFS